MAFGNELEKFDANGAGYPLPLALDGVRRAGAVVLYALGDELADGGSLPVAAVVSRGDQMRFTERLRKRLNNDLWVNSVLRSYGVTSLSESEHINKVSDSHLRAHPSARTASTLGSAIRASLVDYRIQQITPPPRQRSPE